METPGVERRVSATPAEVFAVLADALTAEPGGPGEVLVTLVEDVTRGPARALPKPLRQALMLKRNSETLRRLAFLAEGRSPRTPQRLDDG